MLLNTAFFSKNKMVQFTGAWFFQTIFPPKITNHCIVIPRTSISHSCSTISIVIFFVDGKIVTIGNYLFGKLTIWSYSMHFFTYRNDSNFFTYSKLRVQLLYDFKKIKQINKNFPKSFSKQKYFIKIDKEYAEYVFFEFVRFFHLYNFQNF